MPNKKTTEEFKVEVNKLVGNEYEVLGEYTGTGNKILMKHCKCGHVYEVTPNKFLSAGRRCPKCANVSRSKKQTMTHEQFVEKVNALFPNNEYTVLSQYKGNLEDITIQHNCEYCNNYVFTSKPNYIFQKKVCPVCSGKITTIDSYKNKFYKKFDINKYEIVSTEFEGYDKPIKILHKQCGHYSYIKPSYLRGFKTDNILCQECEPNKSFAEKLIIEYLINNNIKFDFNASLPDCKISSIPLRFDFITYDNSNNITNIIEFDGKQHFEAIDFFGGEEDFKKRQERDQYKDDYCKENNLKLTRISYKELSNIKNILNDLFK